MGETICRSGYIENIVYRNEENGYTVFHLEQKGDPLVCVGFFQMLSEGEFVEVEGEMVTHQTYGPQLKVSSFTIKEPDDARSMERYLASGAIKGIGAAMAARIVRRFGDDTFRIMDEEPERLAEIKGISMKKAVEISRQMEEKQGMRRALLFLQDFGVSNSLAVKIYEQYKDDMYDVMRENPYRLAEDISGVGFRTADEIARRSGLSESSEFRIKSGILYVLSQASVKGHVYLPMSELIDQAGQLLQIAEVDWDHFLMDLLVDRKIIRKELPDGDPAIYPASHYFMEMNIAQKLHDLDIVTADDRPAIRKKIRALEEHLEVSLDELQRQAVEEAVCHGLFLMTGGPGTGKTTTIRVLLGYFESEGLEIALAAPTGRAARRMTEATGWEAQTIHRLLEVSGAPEGAGATMFEKNERNPLEFDVVIVDEMSMVDCYLMNALLRALVPGTRLILVGDIDQLPSVGPGNVLKDIIRCGCFSVVKLTRIFRQDDESDIVVNAHRINEGKPVDLRKESKDFAFVRRDDPQKAMSAMVTLIRERLPKHFQVDPMDVQVLTPTRKGLFGVENLNRVLREFLNPKANGKVEREHGGVLFREGDKVMQIKNDYQIEWEQRGEQNILLERGLGVFNGDTGVIRRINPDTEVMEVEFDDSRFVVYGFSQLDELEPAFAVTIHKSQGSEYPVVIIPVFPGPRMLMTRNLLYTGVTRARKCVCLIGLEDIFFEMVANDKEQLRYSGLAARCIDIANADHI